jgi:hypothetical protein
MQQGVAEKYLSSKFFLATAGIAGTPGNSRSRANESVKLSSWGVLGIVLGNAGMFAVGCVWVRFNTGCRAEGWLVDCWCE